MLSDEDLERSSIRLADFRKAEAGHQDALQDLLKTHASLVDDYRRLKSDYEEERDAREKYKQLARSQDRNPFVLVLIDGDGYIFDNDLVSSGAEGGERAAQLLNKAVLDSLRTRGLENCRIIVRIYANLSGLSKALSRVKLSGPEKRSLSPFVANFNRTHDLFDFVDAGELKENADAKLRATFRQFLDNSQCRQIYFAGCHDVGYLNELTPFANARDRITLVRNYAFHPEFNKLGMRVEDFPYIFRSSALDPSEAAHSWKAQSTQHVVPSKASELGARPPRQVCAFYAKGTCKNGNSCRFAHVKPSPLEPPSSQPSWRNPSAQESSFSPTSDSDFIRGIRKHTTQFSADLGSGELGDITALPDVADIPPGKIAVNAKNQRLDARLPPYSPEEKRECVQRINNHKLCNKLHLSGSCTDPDCKYDHGPISQGMKNYLRTVAAGQICPRKSECRYLDCTLGHVCQKVDCTRRGGRAFCKLTLSVHFTDYRVAQFVDGSGGKDAGIDVDDAGSPVEEAESCSPPRGNAEADEVEGITKADVSRYFYGLTDRSNVKISQVGADSDEESNDTTQAGAKVLVSAW